jgi:hypothetical protein
MSDNTGNADFSAEQVSQGHSPLAKLGCAVSAIVVILLVVALLLPARRAAPEAARRNQCLNNLRQIAIAIQNYTKVNGHLPPAYTVDAEGNRLHSWRTLILPYMEEVPLYNRIDFSKPWDDPANALAREQYIPAYLCPSAPYDEDNFTTYLAVVGPNCVFSGPNSRKLSEVTDDSEYTLMVVDAPHDRAVHWMSPHDISDEEVLTFSPESKLVHIVGFQSAFLDGQARVIPKDIDRQSLRGMLTIAGGEKIEGVEF